MILLDPQILWGITVNTCNFIVLRIFQCKFDYQWSTDSSYLTNAKTCQTKQCKWYELLN